MGSFRVDGHPLPHGGDFYRPRRPRACASASTRRLPALPPAFLLSAALNDLSPRLCSWRGGRPPLATPHDAAQEHDCQGCDRDVQDPELRWRPGANTQAAWRRRRRVLNRRQRRDCPATPEPVGASASNALQIEMPAGKVRLQATWLPFRSARLAAKAARAVPTPLASRTETTMPWHPRPNPPHLRLPRRAPQGWRLRVRKRLGRQR